MKYVIDEDVCKEHNLTLEECLLLLIFISGQNITDLKSSILKKHFANKDTTRDDFLIVPSKTKSEISSIIIDSEPKAKLKEQELTELARKMQEIFPKGKKPGTTYQWRGSVIEITKKLKTLVSKYNIDLNEDDVLEATRKYVQGFNGNYEKMRLLKYFILKAVRDADGNIALYSDLLSLIENKDSDTIDSDWTTRTI